MGDMKRYSGKVCLPYGTDGPLAGQVFDSSLTDVYIASDVDDRLAAQEARIEELTAKHDAALQGWIDARDEITRLTSEQARLTAALGEAQGCFVAADVEGWSIAILGDDMERVRDIWNRRLSFAWQAVDEALAPPPAKAQSPDIWPDFEGQAPSTAPPASSEAQVGPKEPVTDDLPYRTEYDCASPGTAALEGGKETP